jgi:hypothetical protein
MLKAKQMCKERQGRSARQCSADTNGRAGRVRETRQGGERGKAGWMHIEGQGGLARQGRRMR